MSDVDIRIVTDAEIGALLEIERESFSDPWSENMFKPMMLNPCSAVFGAYEDEKLCGFIAFYNVVDEIEILNLAVIPEKRRRGIGEKLLGSVEEYAARQSVRRMFLEARVSNVPARTLYEKHGFAEINIRKNYYERPVEDAVAYGKELENADTRN